jgi:hypothetical protein
MTQVTLGQRERFLAVLLLAIIVVGGCVNRGQNSTSLSASSPRLAVLSARTFWPQALALAQEWRPDVYVRVVRVRVDAPSRNSSSEHPVVRFSFQSPSEDYVTFVVACDAKGCGSFEVEQKPQYPLRQCTPFALDDFALDSKDALDIGLQNGGESYMQLQTVSVLLMLNRTSPGCNGPVVWRASFANLAAVEGLDVVIDAVTGEVVEISD